MSEDSVEINGVTVKKHRAPSGPVWKWHVRGRHGYIVHNEIQWCEADYRWLRAHSITDGDTEGGWQRYTVHYPRAYDEDEAETEVRRVLERELNRDGPAEQTRTTE